MEDPPGSYAPRSPDLSALTSSSSYATNDPYTLPPQQSHASSYPQPPTPIRHDSFSLPQSSYYQPPSLLQTQSASSYGYPAYTQPTLHVDQPMSPQNKRVKRDPDDEDWAPQAQQLQQTTPRPGRPPSKKASKSSAAAAAKAEETPEQRVPAPGEVENIVVKTKFPVARIKRIVQADDEVGKVAQATPVAVGKALELFMIHLTLASASIATGSAGSERKGGSGGGGRRITSAHIKNAILKHDEFDFLRPIAEKIPDGPGGSGKGSDGKAGKGKAAESEDDVDFDFDDGTGDAEEDGDGTYGSKSKRKGPGRDRSARRAQHETD